MMTLDTAWEWYRIARMQFLLFGRLARKYWDALPWESALGKDDKFASLESVPIVEGSRFCLEHLNDFAVLILFSVFESIVREKVLSDVEYERGRLNHTLVMKIVDDAIEEIEHGSFFRVMEIFKEVDANLVEEVNQVRRYRNWVAHGRRSNKPPVVVPEVAFDRLKRFLDLLENHPARG